MMRIHNYNNFVNQIYVGVYHMSSAFTILIGPCVVESVINFKPITKY